MRFILLFSLLFSPIALADAIDMGPEDCPSGSEQTNSHAGTWCEELACDVDEECPEGTNCESSSVCLDVYETACGGMMPDTGEPCTIEVREVLGACESDDDCDVGTCVTDTRCVDTGLLANCGGCSQTHLAGNAAGIFGVIGLLGLLRRRD